MYYRYVAEALFQTLETMKDIVQRKIFVHCIGNSLGAHICGFTGKLIKHKLKQKQGTPKITSILDRISALDPAGPLFFNDNEEYPNGIKSTARLAYTDAHLVDVLHTGTSNTFQTRSTVSMGSMGSAETINFQRWVLQSSTHQFLGYLVK